MKADFQVTLLGEFEGTSQVDLQRKLNQFLTDISYAADGAVGGTKITLSTVSSAMKTRDEQIQTRRSPRPTDHGAEEEGRAYEETKLAGEINHRTGETDP